MARRSFSVTAARTTIGREGFGAPQTSPSEGARATVTADIATLVADGATPTQAHVNTLNTDYTAFVATLGDVELSFDTSKVTSISSLRAACNLLLQAAEGAGLAR